MTIWLKYPRPPEQPIERIFYDCLLNDNRLVRRVFPLTNGDFSRGGVYVAGEQVVCVREAEEEDTPFRPNACPWCNQDITPRF